MVMELELARWEVEDLQEALKDMSDEDTRLLVVAMIEKKIAAQHGLAPSPTRSTTRPTTRPPTPYPHLGRSTSDMSPSTGGRRFLI
jgi:hypothetical protein